MPDEIRVQLHDNDLYNRANEIAANAMEKLAIEIIEDAKRNVHILSSDLHDSAFVERRGNRIRLGFDIWYADIEEHLVNDDGPHAYFRPALYRKR